MLVHGLFNKKSKNITEKNHQEIQIIHPEMQKKIVEK